MDWTLALDRNRALLLRLLTVLHEMLGESVSREVYHRVLLLLRPAESALRRLIVIAARGGVLPPAAPRKFPEGLVLGRNAAEAVPSFPLFDSRLRPGLPPLPSAGAPRIRCIGDIEPIVQVQLQDVPVAALTKRLARFKRVLDDVPRAARRLLRWRARHPQDVRRPMRPGRPPGHRAKSLHWIDDALRDLQQLALLSMVPDTS